MGFLGKVQTFNKAYINGLLKTLEHPLVSSGFPYMTFDPIHDDRTPKSHLALEHFGLNGTNIYRRDDPFLRKFMPPLTELCRCSVNMLSIPQAAHFGVKEAQEWLRTDRPPGTLNGLSCRPSIRWRLEDEWREF